MRLEPPGWWHGTSPADRLKAGLLAPAGLLYGTAVKARFAVTKPYRSHLPVVCVGNFTVGGSGKTPLALAIAKMARGMGHEPAFLTRGYGGALAGPHRVEADRDSAAHVGDEALLLARVAPTVLARHRPDGAKAIEALGVKLIIMDDGFQNPSLAKDLALIAVDAGAGFGNGQVFPAGPLRAPLAHQMERADAAVLIGDDAEDIAARLGDWITILTARMQPAGDVAWLRRQPILAFSGIGRPDKFFTTLRESRAELAGAEPFPDHHAFTQAEALALLKKAARAGAALVTTEKDWVRISASSGPLAQLKAMARPLTVKLTFANESKNRLLTLLSAVLNG